MRTFATVGDIVQSRRPQIHTISPTASLVDAAREMTNGHVSSLLVLEGGDLVGILTWRDVLAAVGVHGGDVRSVRVRDYQTSDVVTTTEDALLSDVEGTMVRRHIRHMPVVRGRHVVGLVTRADVLRRHLDRCEALTDDLEGYITGNRR